MEQSYYNACSGDFLSAMIRVEGPEKAFQYLYDLFNRHMETKTLKYLSSSQCQDPRVHNQDIKQEMWESVRKDLKSFHLDPERSNYKNTYNWLLTIGYNLCAGHLSEYSKRPSTRLEDVSELELHENRISSWGQPIKDNFPNPEKWLEEKELLNIAYNALKNISQEQENIIRLKVIEEMTFVDIARLLKLPEGTIKSKYFRAIRELKRKYHENGGNIL